MFLRLSETNNALQLLVFLFFFLPFSSRIWDFGIVNRYFRFLKILQYGGFRRWGQLFSSSPCKNWYKNWYLHFHKTYGHQVWKAGTSTRVESNETNQVGAGNVSMSGLCDKLEALFFHYHKAYDRQTWQDRNLPWLASAHKVKWPLNHMFL